MKRFICLAISIAFVLLLNLSIQAQKIPSDEKIINQLFSAWNSRDPDRLANLFSEDAVYEDVSAGQKNQGRNEVRKWAAGAFADIDSFKLELVSSFAHNGRGVAEWVWSGTDKGVLKTGKSFSVRGVSIIEIRKGKVSNYKEYYDFAAVMRQLGLLPDQD